MVTKATFHASIIICTRNPRPHYLERVLAALQGQVLPRNEWELLFIDNASEPALATRWDLSWHPNARHLRENEVGIAAARQRGMAEAASDLLIFVDDDNILAADYLTEALKIKRDWPTLGTWGSGTIVPEFEQQPEAHLKPYLCRLALRNNQAAYWSNVSTCSASTPAGAGMCVRASVANEYCHLRSIEKIRITGRQGTTLVGHEDYELAFVGCSMGLGMGVFPELRITHLISKDRVSDEYHLRLAAGNEISEALLAYKWLGTSPPQPFSTKGILSIVKNVVLSGGFHRRQHLAQIKGRIAARRTLAGFEKAKST